jgi:hypothetical protein
MSTSVKTRSISLRCSRIRIASSALNAGVNLIARSPNFTACKHVDEDFVLDHQYATRHWITANLCPLGLMWLLIRCSFQSREGRTAVRP